MSITEFIARCDAFCARHNVTRVWLSKRLLDNTFRLEMLANGKVDIGVKRLERAADTLAALERERDSAGGGDDQQASAA